MDPSDFENCWKDIIQKYDLQDNAWLNDIFSMRAQWIPVYFKDIKMGYLTRTTSRSESENSFFGKFLHNKMTLVEFFLSFESAMDAQRQLRSRLDHESRTTSCKTKTPLEIEKNAAQVYTHIIFAEIENEISSSGFMCAVDGIWPDGVNTVYQIRDKCFKKYTYEVSFNKDIHQGSCSCKMFKTTGIVCRHLILVLSFLDISAIPKEFILMRWSKYATSWSHDNFYGSVNQDTTAVTCELWFEFRSIVDLANRDKAKLEGILLNLKSIKDEFIKKFGSQIGVSKSDFFSSVLGMERPKELQLKSPVISRNKGRGKRLKGAREIAVEKLKKPKRLCSKCGNRDFHDARNCPTKKRKSCDIESDQIPAQED